MYMLAALGLSLSSTPVHLAATGSGMLQVVVRDLENFSRFLLDRLLAQAGVADVNSSFVLRAVKAFRGLPLPGR